MLKKQRVPLSRRRRNAFFMSLTTARQQSWYKTPNATEAREFRRYRESRFQRVAALLSHGEGSAASQAAQLPPHALPLQRVVGHAERKLRADGKRMTVISVCRSFTRIHGNKHAQPLTLTSADSPRSVSFRELHGN